jgi:hypothetical protein
MSDCVGDELTILNIYDNNGRNCNLQLSPASRVLGKKTALCQSFKDDLVLALLASPVLLDNYLARSRIFLYCLLYFETPVSYMVSIHRYKAGLFLAISR